MQIHRRPSLHLSWGGCGRQHAIEKARHFHTIGEKKFVVDRQGLVEIHP